MNLLAAAINQLPEDAVRDLMVHGPSTPHPKWTKEEVLEHCDIMYHQMEHIREWLCNHFIDSKSKTTHKQEI